MRDQLADKFFRSSCREGSIEMQDEKMRDPKIADERDLVLRRGQQMRCILRTQHFRGMWVECDDDRRAARVPGVASRRRNNRLVTEMHTVEDADGQKERPRKLAQLRNRSQDLHRRSR